MKNLNSVFAADIPVGGWRDRLCDCCSLGICHPVLWNTFFCPLCTYILEWLDHYLCISPVAHTLLLFGTVTLGQVMNRMKFDYLGRAHATGKPTYAVMWSIIIMWLMLNTLIFGAFNLKWSQRLELSPADVIAVVLVNGLMLVFAIYATSSTRASLREKYMIREHRFYGVEDCCCATFCMPCTICQMARHTTDYSKYEAVCCSETGLDEDIDVTKIAATDSETNYFCADQCSDRSFI